METSAQGYFSSDDTDVDAALSGEGDVGNLTAAVEAIYNRAICRIFETCEERPDGTTLAVNSMLIELGGVTRHFVFPLPQGPWSVYQGPNVPSESRERSEAIGTTVLQTDPAFEPLISAELLQKAHAVLCAIDALVDGDGTGCTENIVVAMMRLARLEGILQANTSDDIRRGVNLLERNRERAMRDKNADADILNTIRQHLEHQKASRSTLNFSEAFRAAKKAHKLDVSVSAIGKRYRHLI